MTRFCFGLLLFVLVSGATAAVPSSPWEEEYRKARQVTLFQTPAAALQFVEAALQRAGTSDDPWVIALRLFRAELRAMVKHEFEESERILREPLPVPLRKTEIEIRRLTGLAMVQYYRGNSREGMATTDQMVALATKDVPAMAAEAYFMRGNLRMNEADIRTAMRLARKGGDATLELRSEALLVRAFAERQGRYAEAVEIGEKVLPRLEQMKLGTGTIAGNIGSAYFWLGDYETSREFLLRAEAATRKLKTADHTTWLDRLGDAQWAMHDLNGAARSYGEARKNAVNGHRQLPRALSNLAKVAIARGQLAEARRLIEEAIRVETKGKEEEWDDVQRARVIRASVEIESRNFDLAEKELVDVRRSKDRYTRLQAETELGRLYAAQQKNDLAGRSFDRALNEAVAERGEIKYDYRFSFFSSVETLFDIYIDFLVENKQIGKALEITEKSRARTLAEGLATAGAGRDLDAPSIAKRANATILTYWLGTRRSYVWTVTAQGVWIRQLPPGAEIERDLERYRRMLEHGSLGESAPLGQKLFQTLVGRHVRGVAPGSRVIIIADGNLHTLNFETLVVPTPRPHWWIDDVIVTSASSLHLLASPREHSPVKRTAEPALLLVGNAPRADPAFGVLPNAGLEMQMVGAHFRRKTVLGGAGATPQAFLRARPAAFDVIHFVAHGIATRKRPLDSAVILAKDDADDYRLFARDIVGQQLTARLVTISSCHGAGTRAYAGEGLVGLAWAFLRAGAEQVIAALWEVDDAAATKLMNHMYGQIRAGRDPAEALRDAKLALIHSKTSHQKPRYWAPFVIYAGS